MFEKVDSCLLIGKYTAAVSCSSNGAMLGGVGFGSGTTVKPGGACYFKTILGATSVDLIFYAPKVANLGFWKIGPTIAI